MEDYITNCPGFVRPATQAELSLLSKIVSISFQYSEHMDAATAAGTGPAARRSGASSNSQSGSSISLSTAAHEVHQLAMQIQEGALSRISDLRSCKVTDQAHVVDALYSPAVVKFTAAVIAVSCEFVYQQKARHHPPSFEQQQQMSAAAERQRMQQIHASTAKKGHAPMSFAELLLYPDHEQVWVPGGQQGMGTHLENLKHNWEGSKGGPGNQNSLIAYCAFMDIGCRVDMLLTPSAFANSTLSTASHLKLLLEVLVLVGWVEEQEGPPSPVPPRGIAPILLLLKHSLEGAEREEREAFVTSRGKLLLSVLQLLLRKVDEAGGGEGSGVEEGGKEAERLKQLRMVRGCGVSPRSSSTWGG